MSYEIERKVITNYLQAQSFYGLTPFGLDGDDVTVADGAGFMTLIPGEARQTSIGAPGANCHEYVGILAITIIEGDSPSARAVADAVIADLTGLKLDEAGTTPDAASTVVIDFGRNGFSPYLASSRAEAPYHRAVVNAPFVRTERK
ncbi:hypothetical protein [Actibacterium sp. MT2.3-13A]|uniref:hypothetical protein n=1 Tax=Actibacterium sp. MT2.3-13A TaxID=2828332 RepID=UPI001BA58B86|nr:hypothetical protein [Actibacterium sp. MT2.3-13A]